MMNNDGKYSNDEQQYQQHELERGNETQSASIPFPIRDESQNEENQDIDVEVNDVDDDGNITMTDTVLISGFSNIFDDEDQLSIQANRHPLKLLKYLLVLILVLMICGRKSKGSLLLISHATSITTTLEE
mmetsp:Transcript_37011/g.52282  ORF Transcript_37011/g.52282 Transcript_37011/m.52282 type:complete len:130 (+) Transcript_37011:134-523(+)